MFRKQERFCRKLCMGLLVALLVNIPLTVHVPRLVAQSIPTLPPAITRGITVVAGVDGVQFLAEGEGSTSRILPSGTVLRATGRSEDLKWLYVDSEFGRGWIATQDVIAFGLEAVPVRELPADQLEEGLAATNGAEQRSDPEAGNQIQFVQPSAQVDEDEATESANVNISENVVEAEQKRARGKEAAVVLSSASMLNIRSGPGTHFSVLSQVSAGDRLIVVGRNRAGNWLQVLLPDAKSADDCGWVTAAYLKLSDSISSLPVAVAVSPSAPLLTQNEETAVPTAAAAGIKGTLVFQQRIGGTVYAYELATGRLWSLTSGRDPALSPDGHTVAFTRGGGAPGLYLINLDGSDERRIFSGRENLGSPKWSPDGQLILFTRGDEWLSCFMRGTKEVCTGHNEVKEGHYRKINYAMAVVDRNGDGYRDIVAVRPARAPDWTSAGIVYQSTSGLQLTSAEPDAENMLIAYDYLLPITYDPDWQPGGNRIVFQSNEGSHWQLFMIHADGTGRRSLTRPKTTLVDQLPSNVAAAWSPDGRHIAYLSNVTSSGEAGEWKLWIMNADGSQQRPLPLNLIFEYTFGVEQVVSWR